MITFGPIPSRRLGRSLGINNIPPKHCTYACVYCQVGATDRLQITRQKYFSPAELFDEVAAKLFQIRSVGDHVDVLTFVPDGEPTLDSSLGASIRALKPLGVKIAVITNGSLLTDHTVQEDLLNADVVSVKLDAIDDGTWRKVNRPERRLRLDWILHAIERFADVFKGRLITETMLVRGLNDDVDNVVGVGSFFRNLRPAASYLSVPIRPPAEGWVQPPSKEVVTRAFQCWSGLVRQPELLTAYEGSDIGSTGEIAESVMAIASVHPIREEAIRALVSSSGVDWQVIEDLIANGRLLRKEYQGKHFYVRNLKH